MNQLFALLLAGLLCLSSAGCTRHAPNAGTDGPENPPAEQNEPEPAPEPQPAAADEPVPETVWEIPGTVRLSLLQTEYPAGTEKMTLVVENTGDVEIGYGAAYSCEKFADGQWSKVDFVDNLYFADVLYTVEPRSVRTMELNWSQLLQPLEEGLYRITGSSIWVGEDMTDNWQAGFRITPDARPEPDFALIVPGEPISAAAETIPARIVNNTGETANILFIPHLERLNENGEWQEVPYKDGVGFCGMADPLPAEGRDWSENPAHLWGMLEEGMYRLSYEVGRDFETETFVYGEFTVCAPEICAYPLAED